MDEKSKFRDKWEASWIIGFRLYRYIIIFNMAYYHVHGIIPDTLSQSEGYKLFEQYIASGAPKDKFDGFELISRVHAPQTGEVFVTCKADNHLKMAEHFGIWRAKFGVEWNVLPVFNDEEVILRNKQLADEVAMMG